MCSLVSHIAFWLQSAGGDLLPQKLHFVTVFFWVFVWPIVDASPCSCLISSTPFLRVEATCITRPGAPWCVIADSWTFLDPVLHTITLGAWLCLSQLPRADKTRASPGSFSRPSSPTSFGASTPRGPSIRLRNAKLWWSRGRCTKLLFNQSP